MNPLKPVNSTTVFFAGKEPANPTCDNTTHKFSHCDCEEPAPEWRELGPDEVIGVDDEYNPASLGEWIKVPHGWIGEKCDITHIRTRRPLPKQEEMPLEDEIETIWEHSEQIDSLTGHMAFKALAKSIRYLRDEIQKLKQK